MSKPSSPGEWIDKQLTGQLQNASLWYWDAQSDDVWYNFADDAGSYHRCSFSKWLGTLDVSCRLAVRETVERVYREHIPQFCHFGHEDYWYRMRVNLHDVEGLLLVGGEVKPFSQHANAREEILPLSESGLLSCPMFRTLLIQAVRTNANHGEPLVLMTICLKNSIDVTRDDLAQHLQLQLRRTDLMGLFRENELLVLLNNTADEAAARIAEKLFKCASSLSDEPVSNWLKIGWVYYPQQGENVDTLLKKRFTQVLVL